MKLVIATTAHLREMMEWFPDPYSCRIWGGPQFRFPFTEETFLEDSRRDTLPSYVLTGADDRLLGFGQYYLRVGRCHLGRLVISPQQRGQGLGHWLIGGLAQLGVPSLAVKECSLFVVKDNLRAIGLYEKLGFVRARYPEEDAAVAEFEYMVVAASALKAWELDSRQSVAAD